VDPEGSEELFRQNILYGDFDYKNNYEECRNQTRNEADEGGKTQLADKCGP
jgi:hypothetical protein